MGTFLAVSAFADLDPSTLAEALVAVMTRLGSVASVLDDGTGADRSGSEEDATARLFGPSNGWTVVCWPSEFNLHDIAACAAVTEMTRTSASTVHLYDDDYWTLATVSAGTVSDVFCSMPNYFDDDPELAIRYAGDPVAVGRLLGVDAPTVRRYLRPAAEPADEQAAPGDRFAPADPWVFCDLWAKAGIRYPEDGDRPAAVVDLGETWARALSENPTDV